MFFLFVVRDVSLTSFYTTNLYEVRLARHAKALRWVNCTQEYLWDFTLATFKTTLLFITLNGGIARES